MHRVEEIPEELLTQAIVFSRSGSPLVSICAYLPRITLFVLYTHPHAFRVGSVPKSLLTCCFSLSLAIDSAVLRLFSFITSQGVKSSMHKKTTTRLMRSVHNHRHIRTTHNNSLSLFQPHPCLDSTPTLQQPTAIVEH